METAFKRFIFLLLIMIVVAEDNSGKLIDAKCFKRDSDIVGSRSLDFVDDFEKLQQIITADTRIWGFQICLLGSTSGSGARKRQGGEIASFRLQVAENYGTDDFVDLNPVGPGVTKCGRYKLGDSINQPLESVTFFYDEDAVTGVKVATSANVGVFGRTDPLPSKVWKFSKEFPLIGVYGFNSSTKISGIGVIRYDTTSKCYQNLVEGVDAFAYVDDSVKAKGETDEKVETEGVAILTIGIYTAGVIFAILIVFICVLTIEKIRNKRKRITEIVDMKPIDISEHFKGVKERNIAAGIVEPPTPRKRIPVPIMQKFKDDEESDDSRISSRGATRYRSKEVDVSETNRPLRVEQQSMHSTKDWGRDRNNNSTAMSKKSPFTQGSGVKRRRHANVSPTFVLQKPIAEVPDRNARTTTSPNRNAIVKTEPTPSGPPKAAIWTQQVVQLPPIMNQKMSPQMMFSDRETTNRNKPLSLALQNFDWDD